MEYILLCISCYIVGSIPIAFLVVKRRHQFDIREKGTGNIGAMNSYETSESKSTGIYVLILDMIKGLVPALLLLNYTSYNLNQLLLPLILVITGHNFSVFMKFKGGRGLAPSAGEMFAFCFPMVLVWDVIYILFYKFIFKNVHAATVTASVLLPLPVIFLFPLFKKAAFLPADKMNSFTLEFLFAFSSSLAILILLKHINPLSELLKNYSNERKSKT